MKGGNMKIMASKKTIEAAKYFKEEVLEIMPNISLEELSDMVAQYIYYQQVGVSKDLAHAVVEETCI
jgi:ribosome-binding factor A